MSDVTETPTRVLMVDDEEALRDIVSTGLGTRGYDVAVAPDGEAGLERIDEFRPDVLMIDLLMPGMDGYAVLEALQAGRTQHRPRHIIAISALTDRATKQRLRRLGADTILSKPFSLAELRETIKALIAS